MVATLFIIMLGVAFISNYVATSVPQNMYNVEYAHSDIVYNQFMNIQADINQELYTQNTFVTVYTPITAGTSGEPPFASGSGGTLSVTGYGAGTTSINICIDNNNGVGIGVAGKCKGNAGNQQIENIAEPIGDISLYSYNRYYPPQSYIYENGAFILAQNDTSAVMEAPPPITLAVVYSSTGGDHLILNISAIQVYSNSVPYSGTSSVALGLTMKNVVSTSYNRSSDNIGSVHLTIISPYYVAWENYFNQYVQNPVFSKYIKVIPITGGVDLIFRHVLIFNLVQALVYATIEY